MEHLFSLLKFGVCVKHGACSGEVVEYPVPASPLHRLEGRRRRICDLSSFHRHTNKGIKKFDWVYQIDLHCERVRSGHATCVWWNVV